jgi:TRAP-type C4-dicarboxylate transport system substrate-binding protein
VDSRSYFYDAGSRSFYTKSKPIEHPDDLVGNENKGNEQYYRCRYGSCTGWLPYTYFMGRIVHCLQSGVVDGAENNPPSLYTSRHYEVCKFYSLDEHTTIPDVLVISQIVWDKLSEQEKEWIQQAADESAVLQRKLWAESEEESLREVQKAGVQINKPDKDPFHGKSTAFLETYTGIMKLSILI